MNRSNLNRSTTSHIPIVNMSGMILYRGACTLKCTHGKQIHSLVHAPRACDPELTTVKYPYFEHDGQRQIWTVRCANYKPLLSK